MPFPHQRGSQLKLAISILGAALAASLGFVPASPAARGDDLEAPAAEITRDLAAAPSSLRNELDPDVRGLYVAPDGSCYTYSSFGVVGIFRQGSYVRSCPTEPVIPDGASIAGNSDYVFVSCRDETGHACGVYRMSIGGDPAPFQVPSRDGRISERYFTQVGSSTVPGLGAADTALYASVTDENIVRVFDPQSMAPVGWFSVDRPRRLAVDGAGEIWVEQAPRGSERPRILCFDPSGTIQPRLITLAYGARIQALSCDRARNLLFVADNGIDQNIKVYDLGKLRGMPTTPVREIGSRGGIYARRTGQVGDRKLNGPCGVGVDEAGDVFVACCGAGLDNSSGGPGSVIDGAELRCFAAGSGSLRWKLASLVAQSDADFDPALESDVYTADRHLRFDYRKLASLGWADNGYTLDRFRFPDDARLVFPGALKRVFVRHIARRPYLYVADATGSFLAVYRFDKEGRDGETAIPTALFVLQPTGTAPWPPAAGQIPAEQAVWRCAVDRNGDGHFEASEFSVVRAFDFGRAQFHVDANGGLWFSSDRRIVHVPPPAIDRAGGALYAPERAEAIPLDPTIDRLGDLFYEPHRDRLYLSAFCSGVNAIVAVAHPGSSAPAIVWVRPLPAGASREHRPAFCNAGSAKDVVLLAPTRDADSASHSAGIVRLLKIDADTGAIEAPFDQCALVDDPQADPQSLRATRTSMDDIAILDASNPQELTLSRLLSTADKRK